MQAMRPKMIPVFRASSTGIPPHISAVLIPVLKSLNTGMVGIDDELTGRASFREPTNAWSVVTRQLLLPVPAASLVARWQSLQLQHQSEKWLKSSYSNSGPTNHEWHVPTAVICGAGCNVQRCCSDWQLHSAGCGWPEIAVQTVITLSHNAVCAYGVRV